MTPYIWSYQPQTGTAAGATQDYGAVINWLQANPQMYKRIQDVNYRRNAIDKSRDHIGNRMSLYFNKWPAEDVLQPRGTPYVPAADPSINQQSVTDFVNTAEGSQLAGGPGNPLQTFDLKGHGNNALTSYPMTIYTNLLSRRHPGQMLQGGHVGTVPNQHFLLYEEASVPRSGGLNPMQFTQEFPPVVYEHPFSENLAYFPKEFSRLFDPV